MTSQTISVKTGWHGFTRWIDALKAWVWLGGVVLAASYFGLTYALDGRYAPFTLAATVQAQAAATVVLQKTADANAAVLSKVQIKLIEADMRAMHAQQCKARTSDAKQHFANRISDLQNELRAIDAHRQVYLLPCDDLGH